MYASRMFLQYRVATVRRVVVGIFSVKNNDQIRNRRTPVNLSTVANTRF